MSRTPVAIWTILAIVCHSLLGMGVPTVCIPVGDSACVASASSDSCCDAGAGETDCPPQSSDDDCCIDVSPSSAAEPVAHRFTSPRDGKLVSHDDAPSLTLAQPPPVGIALFSTGYGRAAGPPGEVREIVRTSRLLL